MHILVALPWRFRTTAKLTTYSKTFLFWVFLKHDDSGCFNENLYLHSTYLISLCGMFFHHGYPFKYGIFGCIFLFVSKWVCWSML